MESTCHRYLLADELTSDQAAADLARADMAASRVRTSTGWLSIYFAVFGIYFGAQTLLLGLVQPLALRMTLFAVFLAVLMAAMMLWSRRQSALPRGRLRDLWAWLGSGLLYAGALLAGMPHLEGRVWNWVPASAAVALPLCVASWRERRR